ncbi:hypothetical protein FCV25MIE_17001 [Fagus crenata]
MAVLEQKDHPQVAVERVIPKWTPPPMAMYKLNVAVLRSTTDIKWGFGAVVWNFRGSVLLSMGETLESSVMLSSFCARSIFRALSVAT